MGITPQFTEKQIMDRVNREVERIDGFILNELRYIGLEFVRNARISADFTDRTGNLRSSIGFLILKNGKVMEDNFELAGKGADRQTGKTRGYEYAININKSELGYVLVVVAGMQYAAFVEAKGFDVITSSSFKAEESLKQTIEKVGKVFKK